MVEGDDDDPEKGLLRASEEPGMDALRGTFGGVGTIVRARRRQSTIADTVSIRRSASAATHGRNDTTEEAAREWENVAGRGLRRFQLHDAPVPASTPSPPVSLSKKKNRRDSHDSAAAVLGSVRGSVAAADPDYFAPTEMGEKKGGDMEMSVSNLLAQQNWASRHSTASGDIADQSTLTPSRLGPGTKHTMIHFSDETSTPPRRERGDSSKMIPPISHTPPLGSSLASSSGSSTSLPRPGPNATPSLQLFGSPLQASPAQTPDLESSSSATTASHDTLIRPVRSRAPSSAAPITLSGTQEEEEEHDTIDTIQHRSISTATETPPSRSQSLQSSRASIPSTDRSGSKGLLPSEPDHL